MGPTIRSQPSVFAAPGASKKVGALAKSLGADSVFIVSDEGLSRLGVVGAIVNSVKDVGLQATVFDEVIPNPTVSNVDRGAHILQGLQGNPVVVTLGGGSVMDAGKCMAAMKSSPGRSIADFMAMPKLDPETDYIDIRSLAVRVRPTGPAPVIAVPTTSGTGSETNGAAVVTDDASHKKLFFSDESAKASIIILDPALTQGMPVYPSACCGFDVLSHAMEAFTSNQTNAVSDALALGAIRIVAEYLPKLVKDPKNLEIRSQMQLGSYMAASAFSIAQLGLIHATGHQLTALYNQPHGQTLATMAPHVMRFNIAGGKMHKKYAQVAEAFGVFDPRRSIEENAHRAVDAVARLSIEVGTAKSIQMLGGKPDDVAKLTELALLDVNGIFGARPGMRQDIKEMFEAAMNDPQLYPPPAAEKTMTARL